MKDSDLHAGRSHYSRVRNGLRTVMLKKREVSKKNDA